MNNPLGARLFRAFSLGSDARHDAAAAVEASRKHGHEPVAVWVNPRVPDFEIDVPVVRHRHMSPLLVYVEESAPEMDHQLRLPLGR